MLHNKIVLGKFYKDGNAKMSMGNKKVNLRFSYFSRDARKSGMEMAVTTVIMIVLSIAVLTMLIIFLNSQTGFLSRWFKTQSTESNVDAVISACDGLVTTESVYAYCCEKKEVRFGGDKQGVKVSCSGVALANWSAGKVRSMNCPENICGG